MFENLPKPILTSCHMKMKLRLFILYMCDPESDIEYRRSICLPLFVDIILT